MTKKIKEYFKMCDMVSARHQSLLESASDFPLVTDKLRPYLLPRDVTGEMGSLAFLTQNYHCEIKDYLFGINL